MPHKHDLKPLTEMLRHSLDDALDTLRSVAEFDFPDVEFDHELLSLADGERYPIENGTITRSDGPSFDVAEFSDHIVEAQVKHSTALHAALDGERYLTGPLARYSLNSAALSPIAREAAAASGLGPVCRNPFRSILVRAVEVVYAIEESLRIIAEYERPATPLRRRAGPRGRRTRRQRSSARAALPPLRDRRRQPRFGRRRSCRRPRRTRPPSSTKWPSWSRRS